MKKGLAHSHAPNPRTHLQRTGACGLRAGAPREPGESSLGWEGGLGSGGLHSSGDLGGLEDLRLFVISKCRCVSVGGQVHLWEGNNQPQR
jgi:hypothetical protein